MQCSSKLVRVSVCSDTVRNSCVFCRISGMFDSEEFEDAFVKFCKKLLEAYQAWGDKFDEYLDGLKL